MEENPKTTLLQKPISIFSTIIKPILNKILQKRIEKYVLVIYLIRSCPEIRNASTLNAQYAAITHKPPTHS